MPDANHLYAADSRWWEYHIADVARDFEGKCWTQNQSWRHLNPKEWGLEVLTIGKGPGLHRAKGHVNGGSNSGYQAIGLAYQLGATEIVLLGYDASKGHFFGNHPKPLVNGDASNWISNYRTIRPEEYGIKILNASRRTNLDCFERIALECLR